MTTTVPAVMRALRVHARDDPGSLRCEEMAVPAPGIGDVLVEVAAHRARYYIDTCPPGPAGHIRGG